MVVFVMRAASGLVLLCQVASRAAGVAGTAVVALVLAICTSRALAICI